MARFTCTRLNMGSPQRAPPTATTVTFYAKLDKTLSIGLVPLALCFAELAVAVDMRVVSDLDAR